MEQKTELQLVNEQPEQSVFVSSNSFEHAQRVAKMLSSSSLIPKEYQGNIQNTMIALEMANRIGASPLMVMQNLYIVHGKPSWSSTFVISAINSCKKFSPLRFEITGEPNTDAYGCKAWATELATGERIEGTKITIDMAKKEGWYNKSGSKWQTMPEQMLRYRAATFFGRLYAPEILMGMQSYEEVQDFAAPPPTLSEVAKNKEQQRIADFITNATTQEQLNEVEPFVDDTVRDLFNQKLKEVA